MADEPDRIQFLVRFPPDVIERLRAKSLRCRLPVNQLVIEAVESADESDCWHGVMQERTEL